MLESYKKIISVPKFMVFPLNKEQEWQIVAQPIKCCPCPTRHRIIISNHKCRLGWAINRIELG